MLSLIQAASLAPSPHNTQPWAFESYDDHIDVFADLERHLGAIDPFMREMHIAIGCCLENMVIDATKHGLETSVVLFPNRNDDTHVARVEFAPNAAVRSSPLVEAIERRVTNRARFSNRKSPSEFVLTALDRLVNDPTGRIELTWVRSQEASSTLQKTIVTATEDFIADQDQLNTSDHWFRHRRADLFGTRDGLSVDVQGAPWLVALAAQLLPRLSPKRAHQVWLHTTRTVHLASATQFGIFGVRDLSDLRESVEVGRTYQRLHLWATLNGLAVQPLNQVCERRDRELELHLEPFYGNALSSLSANGFHPVIVFRIGYSKVRVPHSVRRLVEDMVRLSRQPDTVQGI